jgi:hypothetical protein
MTALHFAAHLGCTEVLAELLARGADTALADSRKKRTPAQWAIDGGFPDTARRLEETSEAKSPHNHALPGVAKKV